MLCPEVKLIKINSINQVLEEVGSLLGPLFTAAIISIYNKEMVLIFDTITYLFSIILISLIHIKLSSKQKNKSTIRNMKIFFVYRDTISYINYLSNNNKALISVITRSSLCILCVASLLRFILPAYVLELTGSEEFVSYSFSTLALGTTLGGILFSKISIQITSSNALKSWSLYGLLFCILNFLKSFEVIIFALILLGFAGAFVHILLVSFIQKNSDEHNIGKNFSLFSTLANTGESASGALGGLLAAISLKSALFTLSSLILIPILRYRKKKQAIISH